MDNPEDQSQKFEDKKTMRKHLALHMPEKLEEHGILITTNNGTYFFDNTRQLESYLDIEEE